ncbi:MAG: TadE/TadG family type IV pilus assembly protein [Solirubrobacteraceae bacterium]
MLIEFALVLPVLLLLTLGFLQFGLAMNAKIDSTHLTAEGARYIAVNQNPGSPGTLQDYIRSRGDTDDLRANADICVEYPVNVETGTSQRVGDPVKVTLNYEYDLVPGVGNLLDPPKASLPVTSETTMRLEAVPSRIFEGCST